MNNVKAEIQGAIAILSTLSVSGDAVDVMAAARAKLKRALKELESEVKDGG